MMEVKHNTPMEFNDLVTSTNELSNSISSLTDVEGSALEDVALNKVQLIPNLKKAAVEEVEKQVKANESITNGSAISSRVVETIERKSPLPSAIDLEDVELDIATAITPELEDELLAEDEADVVDKLLAEVAPPIKSPADDAEAEAPSEELEKTDEEPTEKPAASNNINSLRDPGDDLDTLLSKINDIVEDCSATTAVKKSEETAVEEENIAKEKDENDTNAEEADDVNMQDSVIVLDDSLNDEEQVESEVKDTKDDKNATIATLSNEADVLVEEEPAELAEEQTKQCSEEDDKVVVKEQEEVITESDKMLIDVDLDALNAVESAKPEDSDTAKEFFASSMVDGDSEKIEEEEKPNEDEKSVTENESENVDLATAAEENSCDEVKNCETEDIAKDAVNPDEVVASSSDESASIATKTPDEENEIVDEANKTQKEDEALKEDSTLKASAENLNAQDSDDDVVFFCEKSNDNNTATAPSESTDKTLKQTEAETKENEKQKEKVKENDDDDVVLLDDDDDDDEDLTAPITETIKDETAQETEAQDVTTEATAEKSPISALETLPDETTESKSAENKEVDGSEENFDKQIVDDATDNARDKFGDGDEPENLIEEIPLQAEKSADAEESNSNCSSSSNLLQESKAVASSEGCEEETDLGNDDDDDAVDNDCDGIGEVEILETDVGDEESKEGGDGETIEDKDEPPAKRMRLSDADEDEESSKISANNTEIEENSSQDVISKTTDLVAESEQIIVEDVKDIALKTEDEKSSMKRSHDDSLGECEDIKQENDVKKLKTEESLPSGEKPKIETSETAVADSKRDIIEIKDVKEDEETQKTTQTTNAAAASTTKEEKPTIVDEKVVLHQIKVVPSDIPVPLYPPPVFKDPAPSFSYDFLKRFKKTLDRLTKADLEELVMQKIAEAIIHKSEFGEMRELIEKQEKTIAAHRTKITELSKQFRDLEMVHSRVLKDIETKNSQFLMPVKITRAVGLQVFIPLKKTTDPATNAAANTVSVGPSPQQSSQYRSTANSSTQPPPLTSPLRPSNNIDSSATSSSASSALQQRSSNIISATSAAAASLNARRGCMQKTTPQRPLENTSSNAAQIGGPPMYRAIQTSAIHPVVSPQIPVKVLNKSASSSSSVSASASAIAQMRNRYSGSGVSSSSTTVMQQQQQQQQQSGRQQPSPTNNVRKLPTAPIPTKQTSSNTINQQYRRIEPPSQLSNSTASATDNYMSSLHQLPTGGSSVSITPAKPKDKSVIDLTDEDDAPNSTTTTPTPTPTPTAIQRQRAANVAANSGTTGASSNYILNKVTASHVRVSPVGANNASKPAARQQISNLYGPGSKSNGNSPVPTNISTPPGTSITRIQVAPGTQRVKYGHPAPLPPTPAQNLHPAWKLPPPRPTIRISNLDNGIVISWTVEESMDRHAECVSYQIYAYQETSGPPLIDSWRHVGDVKAMLLPMAVTLTQFQEGQRYFFAVRAVDVHHRVGPFSVPKTWS